MLCILGLDSAIKKSILDNTWNVIAGVFAYALTRIDSSHAGRAYAAYGGIYIVSSLLWLWVVEKTQPDRWDALGATICIFGTLIILFGPRS
ncbi:MAG: hypothetical protein RLO18_27670 [Gimesia chilikensis]|nr:MULTISPECIES: hypothetical protein [Gimesia]MCA9014852.1 hypothetical protein [Planctomycetaceae bacterium]|tara:strand:+ start:9423 stop:9695 length:273 start_codon:yes stop_codon:yes gene_type:complete